LARINNNKQLSVWILLEEQKMNSMNPKVDFYFGEGRKWHDELVKLRKIVLDCPLTEELKWGVPCYTFQKSNIVLIHVFKEYCAMLFVKGVLLKDPDGILIQQTENVQAARQVRFTNTQEIEAQEANLKAYIKEAIEVERSGLQVPYKKATEFAIADEFQARLEENPGLSDAFYALTPGRQRGYLLFFSAPKQSATRLARVEKYTKQILAGKGLND
jgi:uncharacterized protein YdeI (YjbR/CyaY-like superfamily)